MRFEIPFGLIGTSKGQIVPPRYTIDCQLENISFFPGNKLYKNVL
jgi:hypothetical protein